jgi:IS5 family transposase
VLFRSRKEWHYQTEIHIKYPTDLDLLNESRQKAEELIDDLYLKPGIKDKPRTYRRVARKEFLNVSKMKRKPAKVLRKAIRKQINYLKRDILIINKMLDAIKDKPVPFERRQLKYFFVIRHLLEQQETMYRKKSHQVEDRIVSIHQPHVRPIVRGKARAKTEFGAKINISLLDGYAKVDHFHWDAFNEGKDLQAQVECFRKLTGKYPELLQVDKIYLTRENRRFLNLIRHIRNISLLFCLVAVEHNEGKKYKHLSSQTANKIVCLVMN